ncbi:MAG: PAS domain S-box protein, partial [Burkholderiales bacterium]
MSSRLTPVIEEPVLEPAPRATADRLIFAEGGAFDLYPGPVALVGRGGALISGNGAGQLLAKRLAEGSIPALDQAVESALAGKAARLLPLLLADESKTVALDVAVMPWQAGEAVLLLARDITLERSLRAALVESRQRYKDLVEAASDFAWETDCEGCFTFLSAPSALGFVADELVGRSVSELLAVPDSGADAPFRARAEQRGTLVWLRDAESASRCLAVDARPLFDADGIWCGARGLCRDTTEAASKERALAETRHRERLLGYLLNLLRQEIDPKRRLEGAVAALLRALPASGVA